MENLHAFFYKGRGKSKIKNVALRIKRTLPLVTYRAWEKFTIKRQCVICCKHAQQVSYNTIKHQFANAKFIQCVYQVVRQSGKTFRIKLFHLLKLHGIPPKTLFLSHPPIKPQSFTFTYLRSFSGGFHRWLVLAVSFRNSTHPFQLTAQVWARPWHLVFTVR